MITESFRSRAKRFLQGESSKGQDVVKQIESGDPTWEGHVDVATCPKCVVTSQTRPQICECGGFIHYKSAGRFVDSDGNQFSVVDFQCSSCGGDTGRNYSSDDAERGLHELGVEFFTVSLADGVKFHSRAVPNKNWSDEVEYPAPATIGHVLKTELEKRRAAARQEKAT